MRLTVTGGRVLLPDGELAASSITTEQGLIADVGGRNADGPLFDVGGHLVLPGIIDIHGDGFERLVVPRTGAGMDLPLALAEADRQLVSNGITTAYFGVTLSWETGLRSPGEARELVHTLLRHRPTMRTDARLHLRYEICLTEMAPEIDAMLARGDVDLLAFNDHVDYVRGRLREPEYLLANAAKAGCSGDAFRDLIERFARRKAESRSVVRELARSARRLGVIMAAHDEFSLEEQAENATLGIQLCEFPQNAATARAAVRSGRSVVMGAPNVLRGASLYDRLSARFAIEEGICHALASDYYYPAQLHAAFRLAREGVVSFARAWDLVSSGPAASLGLTDRGALAPGLRADMLVVDDSVEGLPRVVCTLCEGRIVHADLSRERQIFAALCAARDANAMRFKQQSSTGNTMQMSVSMNKLGSCRNCRGEK